MIRKPAVAGRFYPSDPDNLSEMIGEAFDEAERQRQKKDQAGAGNPENGSVRKARGVVSPHAGYIYSGKTAADAVDALEYADTYILIGPNHTGIGTPVSISTSDWETPLGTIRFDEDLLHYFDGSIAVPDETAHRREHSIEVQLPLLQEKFRRRSGKEQENGQRNEQKNEQRNDQRNDRNPGQPDPFRIFPLCMGHQDPRTAVEIGLIIREMIAKEASKEKPKKIAVLATSDFSHYIPAQEAEKIDMRLIGKIVSEDIRGFYETIDEYDASLCGYGPIASMIISLADHDVLSSGSPETDEKGPEISLLSYTNSGEVSGDFDAVVGYAAIALYRPEGKRLKEKQPDEKRLKRKASERKTTEKKKEMPDS